MSGKETKEAGSRETGAQCAPVADSAITRLHGQTDGRRPACHIRMQLPGLNEYTRACRTSAQAAAKMKRDTEGEIRWFTGGLPEFRKPVIIHFRWIESTRKRDLDNGAFAKKFILDALVSAGKLPDDGQKWVRGFVDTFERGEQTGVIIEFEEVEGC